ncbi:MAG: hypothetical protein WBF62_12810, partial [Bradyrhizobium sp.]
SGNGSGAIRVARTVTLALKKRNPGLRNARYGSARPSAIDFIVVRPFGPTINKGIAHETANRTGDRRGSGDM